MRRRHRVKTLAVAAGAGEAAVAAPPFLDPRCFPVNFLLQNWHSHHFLDITPAYHPIFTCMLAGMG